MLHAGPIPWDDDLDTIMPLRDRTVILNTCSSGVLLSQSQNVMLRCGATYKAHENSGHLKVWVEDGVSRFVGPNKRHTKLRYTWPFVDVFFFDTTENKIMEMTNWIHKGSHKNLVYYDNIRWR